MSVYHNIYKKHIEDKKVEIAENFQNNFNTIYTTFYSMANSAFDWRNLPKGIMPYMPEDNMIYWGQHAFFEDGGEFKIYPCYPCGELLENGLYSEYYMVAKNGKQWRRKIEDIEICFNNSFRIPGILYLSELAEKSGYALSALDATLEKAIKPDIISCANSEQKDAISQLLDKKSGLTPFVPTSNDGFKNDEIKRIAMFDIRERSVLDMWQIYTNYKKLYSNIYGIYNIENEKSERLTKGESQSSEDNVRYSMMADMWRERKDHQKRVKEHFNYFLDIVPNRSVAIELDRVTELQNAELNISNEQNTTESEVD